MSFWPFRKINEHKNCVVNTKSKFQDSENDNSEENIFESKQPETEDNSCTEEYLDFSISCGVMERLKGGHYLKDISHGCQPENVEGGILNLATPNKNQTRQPLTLNRIENPKELKKFLRELSLNTNALYRSFSKAYKSQDACSNSINALEQKSKFCFESATVQQFLGRIDLGDMYPLDVYYVEVPTNEQALNLEDKREPEEYTEENSSTLTEGNVSKKQEKHIKSPERETSSAKCTQKRFSNNSQGDTNRKSIQTCQPIKFCCKPLDCTQPMLYRCRLSKEDPSCSNKTDKCKELKDYLKCAENKQQGNVEEEDQQTCKPTKYCCQRVDFKQNSSCGCKKPVVYRCTPYPSDPPCTEKSKVCKELEDYLKSTKNVKRESCNNNLKARVSQSGQPKNGRYSLRKSNEYKQEDDFFKANQNEIPSANRQGNENVRSSKTQRPSRTLDNQNERSSLRNSREYNQQMDSLKGVGEEIPKEYSNNSQRNSSGRASQTQWPLDPMNGRSSLRKSTEYTHQKDYLNGVEDGIPKEYSNNSQRNSSERASQALAPDKSLNNQNGRPSLRKSNEYKQQENYVKTKDEIIPSENVQRGSSSSSQGDARVSQTSQSLKTFDQKDDNSSSIFNNLEDTKQSVSEEVSKTCQPVRYSCKRLDCTQYPPCMIKPKGYKPPTMFSCRLCGPKETTSCSDRYNICKELEDYLQSIRKKRKRESSDKNQEDQPKKVVDPKADRPSLRKSNEYKKEDNDLNGLEKEIFPDENMAAEYSINSQGDASERASQTQRPSRSLDNQNGRSSLRNSGEYKQQGVGEEIPIESSNNYQRNSSLRASQTNLPDNPVGPKNGRSSLRKSGEYKQQNQYLTGVEDEATMESSNNSQRESSGRTSQAESLDKSSDLQSGRSSVRKSNEYKQQENYVKTEDEIAPAENIQSGYSNNSEGDARVSQTNQSLKTFDRKEDLEETKRSVSEEVSKTSQPIKYSCKRLDCTQYPPCMIKPKGYKPPAMFSCRLCSSKETESCSDRSNVCKELEDYLQSIRKKRKRESSNKNQEDQPKEAFDPKEDHPSLRKSKEYKQEDNDLNGVKKEIFPDENMAAEYSNNSNRGASGRTSQKYQPLETLDSKEGRSSLRKSNEYKQRENANGRASQNYQPVESLDYKEGRSSLRKSNEHKPRDDENGRASQNYQPAETLDSKEVRSSSRKSNEYKQQTDASGRASIKNVPNNQGNANERVSQSYQPVETLDSREGRSSLRKSNEYKQQDNYIKTARENIQRGSSKGSQGDARVSQTSQALNDFDHKEDTCSPSEKIAPDSNVSEQALGASQTSKYCCEPVDLTKCQPCLMKTNTSKPPRVYRCWPYNSNQDSSSKWKSNACSGKTNECKQPVICCCRPSSKKCKEFECEITCEDQPCLMKIKTCKIPAKCCCKPCQPKPDPCCPKKTNKCREPIKFRSRPCDSKEDPLDLMKTQVIKQLIDFLKDLKVQLTSAKMKQKALFNNNKPDVSQNGSHTCPCNRPSQGKRMSDKEAPNCVQNNGRKQNENDFKNLNKEMPSESCDARQQEKIKESLRASSDIEQEVISNGTPKETPHLPATLIQKISSDTVQPDGVSKRKKGGCTPSKNKLKASADNCKCQEYRCFDPKLDVPDSTNTNVRKPRDNFKDINDIKEEIPRARAPKKISINANEQDSGARKQDNPISKNILSGRLDSSEKGSQTEQPNNMQSAKAPHKHTLNVAPITLTIPLKLVINSQEGQSNIIETDIIVEATSGAQNQGSSIAAPKTAMPINKTMYMPDRNDSDGFLSCVSESGQVEVKKLGYVKPQLQSSTANPKTPINKTTYMPHNNGSDEFFSCLSGSGVVEVERLGTVNSQNKCDTTAIKTPLNKTTHTQDDSDSDEFFPCLSESDAMVAEPAPIVKPQNIVELEQQVKEGTNSCTIIPTTVPPVSKSVNQQTKTESEKPLKTTTTSESVPEVKLVEEQMVAKAVIQTQPNVMHVTLPAYVEPKSGNNAKSTRYSTPIDYQGIPVNISKRGRAQSKSAEPTVADKATTTSYISGRQLRNEMRMEIQEQLKELLEFNDRNVKHKYDAQERDAILLELHKLFNPEMVDLLPQEISKEITLTSIRYLVEPELLSSTENEIAKLSKHQARILEDLRHLINPKSGQSDGARKFQKESKFKILENLSIILNSRKQERSSDADIRRNILIDLRSLLDTGEVNKSLELEQGPSTCQAKNKKCQQQPPNDIKESLMSDLRHLLDATPNLQAENKEIQGNAVKKESLSNNSFDEPLIDSNRPVVTRKVQTAPPRRTFASIVLPNRYSQRFSTPDRRKTYRDLQSSSSEDFFLDLHDD